MEEVEEAYEVIKSANSNAEVVFPHCTSAYPCDVDDVNLRAMKTMDERLPVPVGYSDHTTLPEMPAFAVSAGACIVEKHFTLDSTLPGPDHEASLEPDELAQSVELVRTASQALGSPEKKPTEAELKNREVVRKSLHAATDIKKGTEISEADIKTVRPADGISPRWYEKVLGAEATKELQSGETITEEDIDADIDRGENDIQRQ
jgi:N-acetylneuraminate synthase/N,N'-diacetyllegionaminate synthase